MISIGDKETAESERIANNFRSVYGAASAISIVITERLANNRTVSDLVSKQTGIFILADGVNRLSVTQTLRPDGSDSLVMTAIWNLLKNGGMVAGDCSFMVKALHHLLIYFYAVSQIPTGQQIVFQWTAPEHCTCYSENFENL